MDRVAVSFQNAMRRIGDDIRHNSIALLLIVCYMALAQCFFGTVCPGRILVGQPCPACGLTRAGILLLSGRFADAWRMNPAIYVWAPLLMYLCIGRYVLGRKLRFALFLGAVAGILSFLIYLCRFWSVLSVFPCIAHFIVLQSTA